jgi:hypothetical protein
METTLPTSSVTVSSISPGTFGISNSSATSTPLTVANVIEHIIESYELNEMVVEHRVQSQEMLKLKEQNVDFADVIKENMSKNMARQITKKISFTKKYEADTDVHSYRGRCWVFTKEEMIQLIKDIKAGHVG